MTPETVLQSIIMENMKQAREAYKKLHKGDRRFGKRRIMEFCPLVRYACYGSECALWNKNRNECGIKTLMFRMGIIVSLAKKQAELHEKP